MENTTMKQTTREGPACGESLGVLGGEGHIGPIVYGGANRREGEMEEVEGRFWREEGVEVSSSRDRMEIEEQAASESDCSLVTVDSGPVSESLILGAKRPRLSEGSTDEDRTVSPFGKKVKERQSERKAAFIALARKKEEDLSKEAEVARFRRETLSKVFSSPEEKQSARYAAQLQEQVQEDLAIITKVATKSSNLKGNFVRALKDAAASIRDAVEVLGARTTSDETRQLQADNVRLHAEMAGLREELAELRERMRTQGSASSHTDETMTAAPASRPSLSAAPSVEEICRAVMIQVGGMLNARLASLEDRLLPERIVRPPLAADKRIGGRNYAATVSERLSVVPTNVQGAARPKAPQVPAHPGPSGVTGRDLPVLAQRPSGSQTIAQAGPSSSPRAEEGKGKKKKRRRKNKAVPQGQQPSQPTQPNGWIKVGPKNKKKKETKSRARNLHVPRSSAVILTLQPAAVERGVTYASVISEAKEKINPADFGAQGVRLRKAANGGRLFEFPGVSNAERADSLAQKLREVLSGEVVRVSRPTKSVALRISGLDDSATSAEVITAIATTGGCPADQLRASELRTGRDGLGSIVIQCPVAAAKKVVGGGRLLVGWVSAQVKLLDARPQVCYKCLATGHISGQCKEEVDRSGLCFRCGQLGHKARGCTEALHCVVCAASGVPADHRVGTKACASPPKGKKKGRRDGASQMAGPSSSPPQQADTRGAEVPMVED